MHGALNRLKQELIDRPFTGRTYELLQFMVDQSLARIDDTSPQPVTFEALTLQSACASPAEREMAPKDWMPKRPVLEATLVRVQRALPLPHLQFGYAKGGGRGNPSLFWLELTQESPDQNDAVSVHGQALSIDYKRSGLAAVKPSLLIRWLMRDGQIRNRSSRGLTLLIGVLIGTLLWGLGLVSVLLALGLTHQPLTSSSLVILLVSLAGFWVGWKQLYEPWYRLLDERVVKAPNWVPAVLEDPCELEIFRHDKQRWIRLVRYTADCPLCGGEVELMPGKPDQRLPLVGRCIESPHIHVFSFDRTSLQGSYLGPILPPSHKRVRAHAGSPPTDERTDAPYPNERHQSSDGTSMR